MKIKTPITNAAAKIIIDDLTAVENKEAYQVAVTGMARRLVKLCGELEKDAHLYREWIAREIQQMPDMGGGKPLSWDKLEEHDKDHWRMRADEAAKRLEQSL